jgi:hypothetical protein
MLAGEISLRKVLRYPQMAINVDKQQFDAVLGALLKAPPAPMESFKGTRAKKARLQTTVRRKPVKK